MGEIEDVFKMPQKPAKRKKVAKACQTCKRQHLSCDSERPCRRCVAKNIPCVDDNVKLSAETLNDLAAPQLNTPNCFVSATPQQRFIDATPQSLDTTSLLRFGDSNAQSLVSNTPIQSPSHHLCNSKGMVDCLDCSFNIHLQDFTSSDLFVDTSTLVASTSGLSPYLPSRLPLVQNFQTLAPLYSVFEKLQLDESVSCHIQYLVKHLQKPQSLPGPVSLQEYDRLINTVAPATPTAVFSPSGIVFCCNLAFSKLLGLPIQSFCTGNFCLFSLLSFPSILSVLDMAIRFQEKEMSTGFCRCTLEVEPINVKHICATSVSTFVCNQQIWILAQFIPN